MTIVNFLPAQATKISKTLLIECANWLNKAIIERGFNQKEVTLMLNAFETTHELVSDLSWIDYNESEFVFLESETEIAFDANLDVATFESETDNTIEWQAITIQVSSYEFSNFDSMYMNCSYHFQTEIKDCNLVVVQGNDYYPTNLELLQDTILKVIKIKVEFIAFDEKRDLQDANYKFDYLNTPATI